MHPHRHSDDFILHMTDDRRDGLPGRIFVLLGAASAFCSVAAGAFGAHALRRNLASDALAVFETAARYQMYHALALLALACLLARRPARLVRFAGWCFVAGTVLFCGSLYALTLTGIRPLGIVTPFGGVAFLAGWGCLGWAAWRAPPRT